MKPISGAKSVGIGPSNRTRANASERWADDRHWSDPDVVQYEEYYVEHDVSSADAKKAAALLKLDDSKFLKLLFNLECMFVRV